MTGPIQSNNDALREFADEASRSLGENLVSIIEYHPIDVAQSGGKPRAHVLLLCRTMGPAVTTSLREPLARATKSLDLSLVLFSRDEFLASLDVFPVEASVIRRSYRLVLGEDVVRDAEITTRHLRHQLEFELRSKKLFLLSQLLKQDEEAREIGQTLIAFYEALLNLSRYYFSMKGKEVVEDRLALVRMLAVDPGIPSETLERLGEIAAGRAKVGPGEKARLVWSFLDAVDRLTLAIDGLEDK